MFTLIINKFIEILRYLVPILLFLLLCPDNLRLHAQWDISLSQYMTNQLAINPAYVGVKNTVATHLNIRNQWTGVDGSPKSYIAGIHCPINKTFSSVGFLFAADEYGPVQTFNVNFSYSYLLILTDQLHLSLGLSGGAYNQSLGLSSLELVTLNDEMFDEDVNGQLNADFGVGAYLFSPSFFVGFSLPHILETDLISYDYTEYLSYKRHLYLNGGYIYNLEDSKCVFKPMALFKMTEDGESSFDFSLQTVYNNKLMVGAGYRTTNDLAFIAGILLGKNTFFSYSVDMNNNSNLDALSHEVSLSFESFKFYKKTRKRWFKKKKKSDDTEDSMKSIRDF